MKNLEVLKQELENLFLNYKSGRSGMTQNEYDTNYTILENEIDKIKNKLFPDIESFEKEKEKDFDFLKKYNGELIIKDVFHPLLNKKIEAIFFVSKTKVLYKGSTENCPNAYKFTKI